MNQKQMIDLIQSHIDAETEKRKKFTEALNQLSAKGEDFSLYYNMNKQVDYGIHLLQNLQRDIAFNF
jgi:hypothetical protein